MRWQRRVDGPNRLEDKKFKVLLCEDVVPAVGAEEECNTNSVDQESEGFIHVVDEWNCDAEVISDWW